jgi:hypothetical protein
MTLYFSSADDADDADFFLNSPLERGQGVCDNHPLYTMLMYSNTPLPLSRGETMTRCGKRCTQRPYAIVHQLSIINYQLIQIMENNKTLWSKILNILITVLTAIATTFTTTSCIDML